MTCIRTYASCLAQDSTFYEILHFLDAADQHGKTIMTVINQTRTDPVTGETTEQQNVSLEARSLKKIFLKLRE